MDKIKMFIGKYKWWIGGAIFLILIYLYFRNKKSTLTPPAIQNLPLTIVEASWICPGGQSFAASSRDVTAILKQKVSGNKIYITSGFHNIAEANANPYSMDKLFGTLACGCPNECTHRVLRVKYVLDKEYTVQFQDDQNISINN